MTARVVGIVSSKGGVGKTTIVANMGVILAGEFGKKVLALDANVSAPNLGLYLGIVYPEVTLNDVLEGKAQIQQAIHTHTSGLQILPASLSSDNVDIRDLKSKIKELTKDYDLILLDSAPGLGDEVTAVIDAADGLLVVTNPELPVVTITLKTLKLAADLKVPIDGIILNRVRGKDYEMSNKEVSDSLGIPVISVIPEDERVSAAVSGWMPVALYAPNSPSSIRLKKLAANIIGEEYVIGFLARLKMLLASWVGRGTVDVERKELDGQVLKNIEKLERYEKKVVPPKEGKKVDTELDGQIRRVMKELGETETQQNEKD
ncbi:MAG: cell division ATPase MinD [Candidatus Hydrothermarchaeaceae archaeon]